MVLNIEYASETSWREVCKKVDSSIVFVDDCSAECLHWHGGIGRLMKAGASGVKEFSSFEGGDKENKKAVFLVASPLVGPPRMILRDIISNSCFEHCIVITSCSPTVLNLATTGNVRESPQEQTALHKLEHDILHWMKNEKYTAEIFHFPYGFVPLTDYLFITPAFNDLFPCFEEDIETKDINNLKGPDWDMESFPLETQAGISYLMTTLNSLLSQLNVREDIYCLGQLSTLVGSLLQKHSTSLLRSKTATSTLSLLLVDRTLDVCTPVSFDDNSFMDCMKAVLPPFPKHSIDVAINMSCLCSTNVHDDFDVVFPGCLHEPKVPMLEWLYHRSASDILNGLSKEICKALSLKEKYLSPPELEKIIKDKFSNNYELIREHSGLLQLSLGVVQTLKSSEIEKNQLCRSFQMLLLQALATDNNTDECMHQMIKLIKSRHEKKYKLENILAILVFFYSFIGSQYEVSTDLEALLLTVLTQAVIEDKDKYSNNNTFNFEQVTSVDEFCGQILKKLHSLKNSRKHLIKYRDVSFYEDSMMPLEYKSVLTQLVQDIIDPTKPGMPDLRHKPNLCLRDNFASRFSMFLNSTRSHITDNESVMIFVIGGITGQEVKIIKNYFKYQEKTVIIGSNSLLTPVNIVKKVFLNNPLKPLSI